MAHRRTPFTLVTLLLAMSIADAAAQTTTRVSVASDGGQAAGTPSIQAGGTAISDDGRFVAFVTGLTNLAPADTNNGPDVFVHDRQTHITTRVSVASDGSQGTGGVYANGVSLSGDGRFVAFTSAHGNLVPADTNEAFDCFVHDRETGITHRVSVGPAGIQAVNSQGVGSFACEISADGSLVAFVSSATNLVPGDTNGLEDIFVHDRLTSTTERVSVSSSGSQSQYPPENTGGASLPSISGDGRYVVFNSDATNLVPDSVRWGAVYVHDRVLRTTKRVASAADGSPPNDSTTDLEISDDGRFVAFSSSASNLPGGTGASQVFVTDLQTGTTTRASVRSDGLPTTGTLSLQTISLSADGRFVAFSSNVPNLIDNDTNGFHDVFLHDRLTHTTIRVSVATGGLQAAFDSGAPAVSGNGRVIAFSSVSPDLVPGDTNERSDTFVHELGTGSPGDSDEDTLPDEWETRFGLSTTLGSGPDGAAGDPDGDGLTNSQELQAGTHPRGFFTRYLAEGATGAFFDVFIALANPGTSPASALLRFLKDDATSTSRTVAVPGMSRVTVAAESVNGLASAAFSTVIESDVLLVADRTMRWDVDGYGAHAETSIGAPATTWYLAEGATHSGFNLFYLIQNPAAVDAQTQVTYLLPAPAAPIVKTYNIAPGSRFNIWVNLEDSQLAATDVSAVITTTAVPIIVERAMYRDTQGLQFGAGHESAGVTAPATRWFLAEGATGEYFDLFVLIANPNPTDAAVRATYLLPTGAAVTKTYTVAANSRFNIWVDLEDPALAATAVSTTIDVTNDVPVIVERAMWWPGSAGTWHEAHNSPGTTSTGTAWALADGEVTNDAIAVQTYILIANTSTSAGEIKVTLLLEGGGTLTKTFTVAANSRFNVSVQDEFPDAIGHRFGALVESVGATFPQIVVERAMYSNADGVVWAAGTNALATRLR